MTIHKIAAVALLLPCLMLGACTNKSDPLNMKPGRYETTNSTTRANGTSVETKDTTTVGYDSYGNKKAVVETKTTQDPPGLLNKTTDQSTTVMER